jgi:hypothetical protein
MAESASLVEMGLGYPETELAQVGMDFEEAETADAAAEIAVEGAEAETADVVAEMDFVSAEMDLAGMDSPLEAVELALLAPSLDQLKSSVHSDSAIQTGC